MKFSLSSFLFTALLFLSKEVIPGVAGDQAAPTFPPTDLNAGEYEYGIEVVVKDGGTSGSADDTATDMIGGVDPFTVTSFFEVSNKYTDIDGADNNIADAITVEVYTTVIGDSEDDCSKGTLIETDQCGTGDCFTISAGAVNRITGIVYPSPTKEDGIVGATTVELSNFMSNAIYVANEDPGETDGTVEFCVRTSTKLGDETVSHIDSKKKILVNLAGNFASLQLVDNIVKADNKDFETTVVKEIDIDTFVCNIRNERVKSGRSYKIGEQFRICVGPQEAALAEGYTVDNFVEVTCGTNTAAPRSLVTKSIPTDVLTSIESLPLKNNRRAIRSVITTGYAVDGITSLSCTGKVSLSYTAPTGTSACSAAANESGCLEDGSEYCSQSSGSCLPMGECLYTIDCTDENNQFAEVMCIGTRDCQDGQCTKKCDTTVVVPIPAPTEAPEAPSEGPSEGPPSEPCAQDSDSCLQATVWFDASFDCYKGTAYCIDWGKDMQRCCPETCGTGALDEVACNALSGSGECTYPNEAQQCASPTGLGRRLGSNNNSNNNNKRSNKIPGPVRAVRDLQPITTGLDLSGGGEAEELLEGLFEVNIEMDSPSNESSSAPFLSSSMTTTTTVVAILGCCGSLLSVVSSMIW